jgi:hypothetical protein
MYFYSYQTVKILERRHANAIALADPSGIFSGL